MRWYQVAAIAAVVGCGTSGPTCSLIGCESLLRLTLPPGVTSAKACIDGLCSEVVTGGVLQLPLSRKTEAGTLRVTASTTDAQGTTTSYAGLVTPLRTRAGGEGCPVLCVNASARLDAATGGVVAV